ncbi:MAG TPA: STAS domain-containing protein [Polyangiaceae bacterium]|jgi:anti-sigma B factor antagonist|nr:STAS domain-containing protein [Polyangiaceae bacterium]
MNFSRIDDGATTTLRIRGELDALSAPELRPLIDDLVESGRRDIKVDLSGLRLIDSSGVGALVSLYKRIRAQSGGVRFTGVTAQPLVIFKLLRLDEVFGLTADAPEYQTDQAEQLEQLPISVRTDT